MRLTYSADEEGQTEPESSSPCHPAMHDRQDQEQYRESDGSRKIGHIFPEVVLSTVLLENRHDSWIFKFNRSWGISVLGKEYKSRVDARSWTNVDIYSPRGQHR